MTDHCPQSSSRKKYIISVILLFLLCIFTAFAMRTHNYNREAESMAKIMGEPGVEKTSFMRKFLPVRYTHFMPYTIECAMMFSYTQDIAAGKKIPDKAHDLHGLEDIAPYRQMIMGLEWFLAWSYRIKKAVFGTGKVTKEQLQYQDNPDLAFFVPVELRLWMSLSSGFIFLLLLVLGCSRKQALFGGIFHAVAISAIARSTGQDIIRGNFAMPFITAFLLLLYSTYKKGSYWKYLLLFLCSFCAFAFWDLSLGLFSYFVIFELIRYAFTGDMAKERVNAWIITACSAILNALLVPFNQTYLMIMSPLVTVLLPALVFFAVLAQKYTFSTGKRLLYVLLFTAALYGSWHLFIKNPQYLSAYSHFSELTRAKILFNNVKPADPSKISYDARMLWTPAMHSADWKILRTMFPAVTLFTGPITFKGGFKAIGEILSMPVALGGYFFLLLLLPLFSRGAEKLKKQFTDTTFFHISIPVFFIGFIYVVRYHEFLIIFLAVGLTMLLKTLSEILQEKYRERANDPAAKKGKLLFLRALGKLPALFACFVLILETLVSLLGNRVYSSDVHLKQTAELIRWFRLENVKNKCVITDFTVGPMLKCYASCAIAMQPQFGLERIRKPSETYLKLLYHGTEKDFAKFCNDLKADFVIHNAGYLGEPHIYSERYIANAVKLKADSPVVMMRYMPEKLRYFCKIEPPRRKKGYPSPYRISSVYTVFKVIRPEDRLKSMRFALEGERLYREGKISDASRFACKAFLLDPKSFRAKDLCIKLFRRMPSLTLSGAEF